MNNLAGYVMLSKVTQHGGISLAASRQNEIIRLVVSGELTDAQFQIFLIPHHHNVLARRNGYCLGSHCRDPVEILVIVVSAHFNTSFSSDGELHSKCGRLHYDKKCLSFWMVQAHRVSHWIRFGVFVQCCGKQH